MARKDDCDGCGIETACVWRTKRGVSGFRPPPAGPSPFAAAPVPRTPLRHRSFHRRLSLSGAVAAGASAPVAGPEAAGAGQPSHVALRVLSSNNGGGGAAARRSDRGREKTAATSTVAATTAAASAGSGTKAKGKRRARGRGGSPPDSSAFMAFVAAQAQLSTIDEFALPLEVATPR